LNAKTPAAAKRASQTLKPDLNWVNQKEEVMRMVLQAKANQVEAFTDALLESGDKTLVETVNDTYWGSGFNAEDTKQTKEEFWLGKNRLGSMLDQIRCTIRRKKQKDGDRKKKDKSKKTDSRTTDRALRSKSGKQSRPEAKDYFTESESDSSGND